MANEQAAAVNDDLSSTNSLLQSLGNDLTSLLSSAIIPVVMVDTNMRIRHMSQMAETAFNVRPSDIGRSITEIRTDFDVELNALLAAVLHDVVNIEREVRDQQGHWYHLQIKPHKTLDDRVDGATLALIDIDAIKKVNRELIDAVELTNSIIETVPEPVLVLDADLRIVIANRSFCSTFDVQPEAIIDQDLYSIGGGQWNKPSLRSLLDDVLPLRKDFLNHPVEFDFPGSVQKSFMACGRYIVQDQDAAPLLLLSLADITQLKKTEAALIKAERLSIASSLAASIAHEINNPLEAITNLLYLASTGDDPEAAKAYATEALGEIAHVVEITQQTLKYYRQPTIPSLIQVSAVLDSLLVLYKGKLRTHDILVRRQYREAASILCLEGDLRQIFANIVANAIDAITSGGMLNIRVRKSSDWRNPDFAGVRATIADSGIGMNVATQLKMYEAFFTTKSAAGTGLGMWISSQLVERLQGDLRVRSSTRPGKSGTTFSLFLPLDRRRRAPDTQPAAANIIDSQV